MSLIALALALFTLLSGASGTPAQAADPVSACPSAPATTASNSETERYYDCEDSLEVEDLFVAAGATAAMVTIDRSPSTGLLDPDPTVSVFAKVSLPASLQDVWNPRLAARSVAAAVGTTSDHVVLVDDRGRTLFDASKTTQRRSSQPRTLD